MAIRFRRVSRLCDPTNKEAGKKVYPVISYQYDTSATLDEFAKEIASASGVSEGETISVLKDFRTLLRKTLLGGRSVNIAGLGYFYLSAQSKGTEKAEDFMWSIPCCRSTTLSGCPSTPSRATSARNCIPAKSQRSASLSARATRSRRSTPTATSTVCGKRDSFFKNPVLFEHRIFYLSM